MSETLQPSIQVRSVWSWVLRDYGMAVVLVLLGVFFSIATLREQPMTGSAGGRALANQLRAVGLGVRVVVVGRDSEQDRAFVDALNLGVRDSLVAVTATVIGEPRDARLALEKLNEGRNSIQFIATTPECSAWTVFENLPRRFPALGEPHLLTPRGGRWPIFLTRQNLLNVANQIVVVAILSAGLTFVIIAGGIDLSVGSLVALAAVIASRLVRDHFGGTAAGGGALLLCAVGAVLASGLIGYGSGWLITKFQVPAFIATLAVMQVANGLAFILAKGQSIYELPDATTWLGRGTGLFGLPHAVVLMVLVYVGAHVLLSSTVLGRQLYAVGSNEASARLCGVRVGAVKLFAYTVSAALAGLGGIVLGSQLKSGSPTYGASYELYAIAAVVVGGASLTGGEGRAFGTLIGALIIAVIQNGMNLLGVESYTQKIVLGFVILAAVLLDLWKKRLSAAAVD